MADIRLCPECGAPLPNHLPQGLCGKCALAAALALGEAPAQDLGDETPTCPGGPHAPEQTVGTGPEGRPTSPSRFTDHESRTTTAARFGDYELIEEIARGGMGVVYKARQLRLDRLVALKMILSGQFASKQEVLRFRGEAEAAAHLRHPNIVAIYETGEHQGQHYFSMEYVPGRSLAEIVRDGGPLPAQRAARYTQTIAEAIHYAHQQGILHRDLKPSNVLIDATDQPRITDFGLAKRVRGDFGLTVTGQVLGSPNFMPPEQCGAGFQPLVPERVESEPESKVERNELSANEPTLNPQLKTPSTARARVGPWSDVYGLGAILYHLLTGRPPFQAGTVEEVLLQLRDGEPVSPRLLNPSVPRDLDTICLKCLEKQPAQRYQTAQEMADELGRYLNGEPVLARPVGFVGRTLRWCRRKPALAAAYALVGLLLLVLSIGSPIAAYRINKARQLEQRENYYSSIGLADHYIQVGSVDRALDLLLKCPREFRHWEWGYLMALCHQDILSIAAHTNRAGYSLESLVSGLAFDASGTRLLTHGRDGQVKIWDATEGKLLFALGEPTNPVVSWAFHPQQAELALGMTNGGIRRIDLVNGRQLGSFDASPGSLGTAKGAAAPPAAVTGITYDPSGQKLAAATANGQVRVWERQSGRETFSLRTSGGAVDALQYTTDGRQLILQQGLVLRWHDADAGREEAIVELDPQQYRAAFVDPSGRHFATIDGENQVKLWSEGRPARVLGVITTAQPGNQRRVFFSRDGRFVCTAGDSATARVYRVDTGEEVMAIPQRVYKAVFSPDGTRVATLSAERSVKVWDLVHKREELTLRGHLSLAETAAFSPDGRLIATASREGVVKVWSARPGRSLFQVGIWPWAVSCSPDGRWITAALYNGDLNLWDARSGQLRLTLRSRCHVPMAAAFSPDGSNLVTAGLDDTVRLWEANTGRSLGEFPGQDRAVLFATYSPDGRRLAVGDAGGGVRIWDVQSRRELHRLRTRVQAVFYIDFDPSGRKLVAAGLSEGSPNTDVPTVWDVESGKLLFALDAARSGTWGAEFSPDGRMIAVAALDGKLRLWDAQTGELLTELACRGQGGWLSFTRDGQRLVFSVADAGVYGYDRALVEVWDVKRRRQLLDLGDNTDDVYQVIFMPTNSHRLLMGNLDFTLRQVEAFPWQTKDYTGLPGSTEADRVRAYARAYWRDRLAAEGATMGGASSQPVVVDADESSWPARDPGAGSQLIDLLGHYNGTLRGQLEGFSDYDWDNDLSALSPGLVTLGGVQFDVRGVVLMRRLEKAGGPFQWVWDRYPTNASGMQIGQKVRRLQVLQGACLGIDVTSVDIKDGTVIGSYVWHYADRHEQEQEVVYGRDLRDWWQRKDDNAEPELERGRVVWTGTNPVAKRHGATLRLYLTTYDNPRPDVEVTSIDFVSKMTTAAPFLVAMSVEP